MNLALTAAAALAFLVGLIHSVLGERMIFSRMRQGGLVPTNGGSALRPSHVRILWASWHALTAMGWAIAGVLLLLAQAPPAADLRASVLKVASLSMLASALLVLYGTKGRHPGWIGLLGVAVLTWLGIDP